MVDKKTRSNITELEYTYKDIKEKQGENTLLYIEREEGFFAALYIAETKEESFKKSYIEKFLERNKETLVKEIQTNEDDIVYFMQVAYLCFMNVSEERCLELCTDFFSENSIPEISENHKKVNWHYANAFVEGIDTLPDAIGWEKKFCRIALSIFQARKEDIHFLHSIEMHRNFRQKPLWYLCDDESARKYFDTLCQYGDYVCARNFLDHFINRDRFNKRVKEDEFLGMKLPDFIDRLYHLPSPELLTFGKYVIKKVLPKVFPEEFNGEYSYKDWENDILKHNTDADCIKWIKLTSYYYSLSNLIDSENLTGFEEQLEDAGDFEMFDMDKFEYMKQIVDNFVFIINKLILLSYKNLSGFLKSIQNINIGEYSRVCYLSKWRDRINNPEKDYDYAEIEKNLFEKYTIEDIVSIYMNSHLKLIFNIEDIIIKCTEKKGKDIGKKVSKLDLSELFGDYQLRGVVSVNPWSSGSIRDKFFITPTEVASDVTFHDYKEICKNFGQNTFEAREIDRKLIRSDQIWCSKNKKYIQLIRPKDTCTFYIHRYIENKGILAKNISTTVSNDIKMKRWEKINIIYPDNIRNWLCDIRTEGKFLEWDKNNAIYDAFLLEDNSTKNLIALDILETILALQKNIPALELFIQEITMKPRKEMNAFRYVSTRKSQPFTFVNYPQTCQQICRKADEILKNKDIPETLRKDIYINTCIRKVYDLQKADRYIGKKIYSELDDDFNDDIVVALRFEYQDQDQVYYFSTKMRDNTFRSNKPFKYKGENMVLKPGHDYSVTLKEYDGEEECFVIDKIYLENNEIGLWQKFLRTLREIKKIPFSGFSETNEISAGNRQSVISEIKEKLATYQIEVTSERHIKQLAYEMNCIFESQNYDIASALETLDIIGDANPFRNSDGDFGKFEKKFYRLYYTSYVGFLENCRQKKFPKRFCKLYFSSYLKVFISYNDFIDNIAEILLFDEEEKEELIRWAHVIKENTSPLRA